MVALFLKTKIIPEHFAEEIEVLLDRDELDRSFMFTLTPPTQNGTPIVFPCSETSEVTDRIAHCSRTFRKTSGGSAHFSLLVPKAPGAGLIIL